MDRRVMTIPAAVALPLLVGCMEAYYASTETVQIRIEAKTTRWWQTLEPGMPQVQFLIYTDRGSFRSGSSPSSWSSRPPSATTRSSRAAATGSPSSDGVCL